MSASLPRMQSIGGLTQSFGLRRNEITVSFYYNSLPPSNELVDDLIILCNEGRAYSFYVTSYNIQSHQNNQTDMTLNGTLVSIENIQMEERPIQTSKQIDNYDNSHEFDGFEENLNLKNLYYFLGFKELLKIDIIFFAFFIIL